MNPFGIVKDSSVWVNPSDFAAANNRDPMLRIGIVKKAYNDGDNGELRYLVEVQNHSDKVELNCRMMRRFGGVYNYEDYIMRGYSISDKPDPISTFEAKAGDAVLVGQLNGQGREGIIIGSLTHAARVTNVVATDGPQYMSEFNGVETRINTDGELTVTFKGQPTNLSILNNTPSQFIQAPTYDTTVGSSFYKFDKTGSWLLSDNSTSGVQSMFINKPNGEMTFISGSISLKFAKSPQSVNWICKTMDVQATDKVSTETKEFTVDAKTRAFIKAPAVAIGKDGIELLDQLAQLVDALGQVTPISPVGDCTSLTSSPGWEQVEAIKAKIKEITGSF